MGPVKLLVAAAALALGALAGVATAQGQTITAFEGARLIIGNGSLVENGTMIVEGTRIVRAGAAADVRAPAGATRVSLAGKTVMPTVIDTHVHLSPTRERLVRDLKLRAYYGVSAALSMGTDNIELLPMRGETIPGAARFLSAGRGITMSEPGRTTVPYWITTEAEGRKAVEDLAGRQVDIVKIWVDTRGGKYKKLTPEIYGGIIDQAHKRGLRVIAHIFELEDAKGLMRAGIDAFAHGVRDRDIDDETVAMFKERPNLDPYAEPAGPRRQGGLELAEGGTAGVGYRSVGEGQYRSAAGAGFLRNSGAQPGEAQCRGRAHHARHRRQPAVGRA
jgi:imidazolonepropionase-like amidohydrolase